MQVQALVAEHKLGAAGRKLGMAMQKELINTPERLAREPTLSRKWAAKASEGKPKSRKAKQAHRQTAQAVSRPRMGASDSAAAHNQGATAESVSEDGGAVDSSPVSESQDRTSDAVEEGTVRFLVPEAVNNNAEVRTQW